MFVRCATRTGTLRVTWEPPATPASEARLWLLLVDPATLTPDALHPARLLRELIRIPVAPQAGEAIVHAPVERPLGLALVGRDAADAPTLLAQVTWAETQLPDAAPEPWAASVERPGRAPLGPFVEAPAPPTAGPVAPSGLAAPAPSAPRGTGSVGPLPHPAAHQPAPPDRRRAPHPVRPDAIAELAARLLAAAPRPRPEPVPGGFGLAQPWTLGRLCFEPLAADVPHVLVRRATFIDGASVAAWAETPPADAIPLPPGCDGVVDGLSETGSTAFYLVLARSGGGWRSLPLHPVPPPFDRCAAPLVLGPALARLEAALGADAPAPLRELLLDALRGLP
jgi:hypothetical protein